METPLNSIISHSTAIEGSTVTEIETQLLFDEGITAKGKPMIEQLMNLDLKVAYDYGRVWIKRHEDITTESIIALAAMAKLHCQHLQQDIDQYVACTAMPMADKTAIQKELADKWSITPSLARKMADIITFWPIKKKSRPKSLSIN